MKKNQFINREITWLTFNHRVLQEAKDPRVPLVERVRFLGIFSNNLDEFFRVRVATTRRLAEVSRPNLTIIGGKKPVEILNEIQEIVLKQKEEFSKIYDNIIDELRKEGIHMLDEKQLDEEQKRFATEYYIDKVAPRLVPIMLKSVPRFPELRDKSIYLAVKMWSKRKDLKKQYALIEVPADQLPRFLVLPSRGGHRYIMFLDDIIRLNFNRIFGIFEYENIEAYTFKITRDAELDIDDDVSKGFYEKMKRSLKQRKRGQPVRFVYDSDMPEDLLKYIRKKLDVDDDDNVIPGGRYHNSKDFMKFPNVGGEHLEYKHYPPIVHPGFEQSRSMLDCIAERDILLQYPYHNFSHFVHFLREAAIDPNVTEIHITIYRVARQSRVINALINAAKNGKKVTAMVELRARFDEEANLEWSKKLQDAGAKVLFGVPEMKVHAKLCVVTKKVKREIKNFAVISTGNFHEGTAKLYCDTALFTSRKELCKEALKLFSVIETPYRIYRFRHLLVSPYSMRNKNIKLLSQEIKNAKQGKEAFAWIKVNSVVDEPLMRKLYQASQAGVKIRLMARSICALKPQEPGLSENIEARSIVDRYLEHSRVFIYNNGGDPLVYISSADWMKRNLDHRFEVSTPIYDPQIKQELIEYFELQWSDNQKARILDSDLSNSYVQPEEGQEAVRSQIRMYEFIRKAQEAYFV